MATQAIFETYDRFPKQIFVGDEKILHFNRQNLNLARDAGGNLVRLKEPDSWICVLTDPDLIKRAKSDKRFGKAPGEGSYWEVDKVPTKHDRATNIRTGPGVSTAPSEGLTNDLKNKYKRFGQLEAQILLKDGTYSKSADQSLIEEYEKLKAELN